MKVVCKSTLAALLSTHQTSRWQLIRCVAQCSPKAMRHRDLILQTYDDEKKRRILRPQLRVQLILQSEATQQVIKDVACGLSSVFAA